MKTTLLLTLMTVSFMSVVSAANLEKYIEVKTGKVIEVSENNISDAGRLTYFDHSVGKKKTLSLDEVSKATKKTIAGVKAGERILVTTLVNKSTTQTVSRYCDVYEVFENKMAQVGCIGYAIDREQYKDAPKRLDFIVGNVETVTAEVQELDGFSRGEKAELRIKTANANVGRNVRIIAIFTNGEALVEKTGYSLLNATGVVNRGTSVDRIHLTDLNKIN